MINAEQQRDWLQSLISQADAAEAVNDDRFQLARSSARQAITTLPSLNNKQEAWRYSRIDKLFEQEFHAPDHEADADKRIDINEYVIADLSSYRLVVLNGVYQAKLSSDNLPAGLRLGGLQQMHALLTEKITRIEHHAEHLLTALNTATMHDGLIISIDSDTQLDKPIEVIYLNTQANTSIQIRSVVALDKNAKATLVERFIGIGETNYFNNILMDIDLAEHASLTHYRVQDESRNAYHLSSLYLNQQQHSHYSSTGLSFGGVWSRTDLTVNFKQEHAECILNGLYTVGEKQLNDTHLDVQHNVPFCTSREQYKGILYGKGRAVFDGHILVDKQAQKSDAQLTNDNLMLTRDAEVDTKPQLEIYADDVKCSHGTTVGQLDEQQVFYLRSRGIGENAARRMLCLGFAGEIIDTIENEALRNYAADKLLQTLNEAVDAMEQTHGDQENVLS